MNNAGQWLNYVSHKLAANSFKPLAPETYQPQGYRYAVRRSRFEISKFGIAETFFTFAEIPALTISSLTQYSAASFAFSGKNRTMPLPNGIFGGTFCFAVVMTENLAAEVAEHVANTTPPAHWAAFEYPVVIDLISGNLVYFDKTPLWGAAYYAGFRKQIELNLR